MRHKNQRIKPNLKSLLIALFILTVVSVFILTFIKSSNNLTLYTDSKAPNFSFKYDSSQWTVEPEDIKNCEYNRLDRCGDPVGRGYKLISKKYGENLTLWIGLGLGGSAYIKSLPDLSEEEEHCFTDGRQLINLGKGWHRGSIYSDNTADKNNLWVEYFYRELNFSSDNCLKGPYNSSAYGEFKSKEYGKYIGAVNISLSNRVSKEMSSSADDIVKSLKF